MKARKITLKRRSGASLMFVLGIMMLLLALGTSALAAASANSGYAIRQRITGRLDALDQSVHKSILFSLSDMSDANSLGRQFARLAYDSRDGGAALPSTSIDVAITGIAIPANSLEMTMTFNGNAVAHISPFAPAKYIFVDDGFEVDAEGELILDDEDKPIPKFRRELETSRVPKLASLDHIEVSFTVTTNSNNETMTSRATYTYSGGQLSDDPLGDLSEYEGNNVYPMQFTNYGRWGLVKYEKIDTP